MRFPQEVVVQSFLPTYRNLLAHALSARDLPQRTIADLVGVTQAQVSKYLDDQVGTEPLVAHDPRVQETVAQVAQGLAEGSLDAVDALAESLALVRRLQNNGPLAHLHEEAMPALRGTGFDATIDPDGLAVREHRVLTTLRLALRRLSGLQGLAPWVPHVGSNLAQARPGAETVWDVAALPGRIDAVGGAVRVPAAPAFGASRHVATVLLGVLDVTGDHHAALNLAYRPELRSLADRAGLGTCVFDAQYDGRRAHVRERLEPYLQDHDGPPALLYHEGAFGIEPVSYLLGTDALDVVERVRRLVEG